MPLFEGPPPFFDNVSFDFRFTVFNKCLEICDNIWDVSDFMVENCLEDIGDQRFGLLAY